MDEDDWDLFNKIDSETDKESDLSNEDNPTCFSCKSKDVRFDSNDNSLICNNCGIVLCTLIDKLAEKTNALSEGSMINFFLPKSSLGTTISGNPRMKIRQVNDWWKWVYKEKAFYEDKKFIEEKCFAARVPQPIVDNALNLYKKISESRHREGKNKGKYLIIRGVNRTALMASTVYYGAKMQKQPRSPKEVADIFDLKLKYMNRGRKKFLTLVDTSILVKLLEHSESCDFVERYCQKLGLSKQAIEKAVEIIKNVNLLQLASSHEPPSVAAASILLASDLLNINVGKKDLHTQFQISEVTISKTYKKIYPFIKVVSDTEITKQMLQELKRVTN